MLTWKVGDVTITKIVEMESVGGSRFILPQATREAVAHLEWMKPHFMSDDHRLKMSVHALLVRTPTRRIIVDTCIGNDKQGRFVPGWNHLQGPFLSELAKAGQAREDIDTVLCTHLHVDHVGWNTMLVDGKWQPTFPNARYLIGRAEFEYWRARQDHEEQAVVFADSVRPVFDAGLVELVETSHQVCDELRLVPTLGHTPGHVSVRIESRGQQALITGDFIHHPCQMAYPAWASAADVDPEQSTRTRWDMFGRLAGTPTLVIGTHFAGATAGRIVRDGEAFRLETD
ncbi:MAG: MBL fold metallo-hydrolase [Quisquiliibacterium sp.]